MILISAINIEEAGSRAKVYNELFTTVLDRKWDKDKRLKKYRDGGKFEKYHLRRYLAFLAYKIFQYNKGYLNKSEVVSFPETEQFVKRRLRIENEEGELKDVLKDVLTSFYLKETSKNKKDSVRDDESHDYAIEFLHKSLYEYLACEHLWEATKNFFLERNQADPDEYKDHSLNDVQRKLQDLFASTSMTYETMEYMEEIINQDRADHDPLSKRMSYFLPRLLKNGFLFDYSVKQNAGNPNLNVEQQSLNLFHNFWLILGNLNLVMLQKERFIDSKWETLMEDNFLNYINDFTKVLNDTQFQSWIRGFLHRKWVNSQFEDRNNKLLNEKEAFIRQLRLLAAERMPMRLNLSNTPLEKSDLIGVISEFTNFSSSDLSRTKLFNAVLVKSDLSFTDFRSADLSYSNLLVSNFGYSDLRNANLRGADLESSSFANANLRSADLRGANLLFADCREANFQSVNLSNANFELANLNLANFRNADLRNVNLHRAKVNSPDWLESLKELNVTGLYWLIKNYVVSQEKVTFITEFDHRLQIGYQIIDKKRRI